jgi:hypothetical protein
LIGALLLLFVPPLVSAQVIDDFEQGAFFLGGTTFDSAIQTGLLSVHCITTTRADRMYINGTTSGADLSLFNVDNQVTTVWGNGGGRLEFDYDPTLVDLTYAGALNAFRVDMPTAVAAGQLEVLVRDDTGIEEFTTQSITGSGVYFFPYSDYSTADLRNVEFIRLSLEVPDFGDYHIADFRAWELPASASGADVTTGAITGPPYPTEALQIAMSDMDPGSGLNVETEILALSLRDFTDTGGPVGDVEMTASDSGGGIGMPGEQVGIVIVNNLVPKQAATHYRTLVLRVQVQAIGNYAPVLGMSPKMIHPPDPGLNTAFGLQFSSYSMDRDGAAQFRTTHWLSLEVPEGSGLSFSNIQLPAVQMGDSFFDITFDVDTDAMSSVFATSILAEAAGAPLVSMQLNASSFNYGSTTGVGAWSGNQSFKVWAQPNVMGETTQLRLSRALNRRVQLQLFDLAGRAVRTVTVPAGRDFVTWDGRDDHGNSVASGMYMLRAGAGVESKAAKIVKIR